MRKSNGKTMPETKPLWYWDDSVKRYRSPETGRFVGIDEMNALRSEFMTIQKTRMIGVTNVYSTGTIDIFTYEKQVKEILRQTYIDNYVMGKGGRNMMTQADWGRIGGMLKEQYSYLNPFMEQIARGELSQAQIDARLKMYINSASEAFWRGFTSDIPLDLPAYPGDGSTACLVNCQCQWHIVPVSGGYDAYWRLGVAEHCPDCVERARIWNPYSIRVTGEASDKSIKYDPNQPRVPAGHSDGGQWTDEGGGQSAPAINYYEGDSERYEMPFPLIERELRDATKNYLRSLDYETKENLYKIETVNIADLYSGQPYVRKETVEYFLNGGKPGILEEYIRVARINGKLYLMNGNHRVVAAYLQGDSTVLVKVIDIPYPRGN